MSAKSLLLVARVLVFASWGGFCVAFLFRKRPPQARVAKRDRASYWGIVLQSLGYLLAWSLPRGSVRALLPVPRAVEVALAVVAIPLSLVSAWLTVAAVRVLGAQWSYEARLTESHRLVVAGPYSYMRHPIYSAMLGLLIATGLVISDWAALIGAVVLFGLGTAIRIRVEEKLLRGAFGEDFEAYTRCVPAVLPRFHARQTSPQV